MISSVQIRIKKKINLKRNLGTAGPDQKQSMLSTDKGSKVRFEKILICRAQVTELMLRVDSVKKDNFKSEPSAMYYDFSEKTYFTCCKNHKFVLWLTIVCVLT